MDMNFQNTNRLNVFLNLISGNLLPLSRDRQFSRVWKVYGIITTLLGIFHTTVLILAFVTIPLYYALRKSCVLLSSILQGIFMLMQFYTRKDETIKVIDEINNILHGANDIMNKIMQSTLNQMMKLFTIYGIMSTISIILWSMMPIRLIFKKSQFYYLDYNTPVVLSPEPFSASVMVVTCIFTTIGTLIVFLKRYSADIYMMHMVLLLTAQYRYIAVKYMMFFRNHQSDYDRNWSMDRSQIHQKDKKTEFKELCRLQNNITRLSIKLRDLLSFNFTVLYLQNIVRFTFLVFGMIIIRTLSFVNAIVGIMYVVFCATEFFLMCCCVQMLSDTSTEVTDKAFDEGWYEFGKSIKRTFMFLMMANSTACKPAAVGRYNISLPSFMSIVNQSYTIAILLVNTN